MNNLLQDLIIYISEYLSIPDICIFTLINKRYYKLRDKLIENRIKRNIEIWTNKSLYLLDNMKNSDNQKKKALANITKLAFDYPIFLLKWSDIKEELRNKLSLICKINLWKIWTNEHFKTDNVLLILYYVCRNQLDYLNMISPIIKYFYDKNTHNSHLHTHEISIKTYINYYKSFYTSRRIVDEENRKSIFGNCNNLNIFTKNTWIPCKKICPEFFYKNIRDYIFNEKEWKQYLKYDLKYGYGDDKYFKTKQDVINYYKDKPLPKLFLQNLLRRGK